MRDLRWVFAILVALAVSAPIRASAQQPSLADRETARALMDEGDRKRDSGDLAGALKSYEAADALMRVPTTGIDVARMQIALGMLLEARETLTRLLRIPVRKKEPAPFVAARKAADALYAELSEKIPSIEVVLKAPPDADVYVTIDGDDVPPETLGLPRKVNPGAHVIVARAGELEKRAEIEVREGEQQSVEIDLSAASSAPDDDAVDSEPAGRLSTTKLMTYSGLGLAAVGLVAGTITGVSSLSKTSALKDRCPGDVCPPDARDDLDSATTLGSISTAAFIAGGAGLAIGVVGLVLSRDEASDSAPSRPSAKRAGPSFRAVLGPSYAGVAGSF